MDKHQAIHVEQYNRLHAKELIDVITGIDAKLDILRRSLILRLYTTL